MRFIKISGMAKSVKLELNKILFVDHCSNTNNNRSEENNHVYKAYTDPSSSRAGCFESAEAILQLNRNRHFA
jgi:hypothetical protein